MSININVLVTQPCPTLCNPMDCSLPGYWSGLPYPSPGDLPNPGIEAESPALAGGLSTIWATREAHPSTWGHAKSQTPDAAGDDGGSTSAKQPYAGKCQ